jgi:hypothetical protein
MRPLHFVPHQPRCVCRATCRGPQPTPGVGQRHRSGWRLSSNVSANRRTQRRKPGRDYFKQRLSSAVLRTSGAAREPSGAASTEQSREHGTHVATESLINEPHRSGLHGSVWLGAASSVPANTNSAASSRASSHRLTRTAAPAGVKRVRVRKSSPVETAFAAAHPLQLRVPSVVAVGGNRDNGHRRRDRENVVAATQLAVAPDTPPLDGPELKLLCHIRRDGVTSVAVCFFQRRLSGAATAAPRRCVVCEAGVQVNARSVSPTVRRRLVTVSRVHREITLSGRVRFATSNSCTALIPCGNG